MTIKIIIDYCKRIFIKIMEKINKLKKCSICKKSLYEFEVIINPGKEGDYICIDCLIEY